MKAWSKAWDLVTCERACTKAITGIYNPRRSPVQIRAPVQSKSWRFQEFIMVVVWNCKTKNCKALDIYNMCVFLCLTGHIFSCDVRWYIVLFYKPCYHCTAFKNTSKEDRHMKGLKEMKKRNKGWSYERMLSLLNFSGHFELIITVFVMSSVSWSLLCFTLASVISLTPEWPLQLSPLPLSLWLLGHSYKQLIIHSEYIFYCWKTSLCFPL